MIKISSLSSVFSSYSCYCIDGYTGKQCQTNWDECWSAPCLNGATCIDGVAQYNCSCPDGFNGKNSYFNLLIIINPLRCDALI